MHRGGNRLHGVRASDTRDLMSAAATRRRLILHATLSQQFLMAKDTAKSLLRTLLVI
jgi:hypothetical protein